MYAHIMFYSVREKLEPQHFPLFSLFFLCLSSSRGWLVDDEEDLGLILALLVVVVLIQKYISRYACNVLNSN